MKTLIIDNEPHVLNALVELIQAFCSEVSSLETADSVKTGIEAIKNFQPDILLLDVELDDGTGFDILNHIMSSATTVPFQLIFTTAHDKYAIKAFQFCALDYLLKPVDPDLLQKSILRAVQNIRQNDLQMQLQILMQQMSTKKDIDRKIVLKDSNSTYFIKVDDILFCEAEGTYTKFQTTKGDSILISKNLKEYETLLEPLGFIRPHHSFLVNMGKVKMYEKKDGGFLVLENDSLIPISQRKKDVVLKLLETHV